MALSAERAESLRQEYMALIEGRATCRPDQSTIDALVILNLLNEIEQLKYSSD